MTFYIGPDKLREARRKAGLTIEQVNEATGLSAGTISSFERNLTDLRLSTVRKLHKVYKTEPEFWLNGEEKAGS